MRRYGQLWEQHEQARKKFYEMYFRVDPRRKANLEKQFVKSIATLRKFEEAMEDWQRETLEKHFVFYKLDSEFSSKNSLPLEGEVDESLPIEDPHVLLTQKERESYSDDTEESQGSIEDFQKYKESRA
jgi:hypothetical protein